MCFLNFIFFGRRGELQQGCIKRKVLARTEDEKRRLKGKKYEKKFRRKDEEYD
jgi:hypothetical protein